MSSCGAKGTIPGWAPMKNHLQFPSSNTLTYCFYINYCLRRTFNPGGTLFAA
jgi:hypothetical protein